ncbi:YbaK/EbsC family protein [Anaerolineales bacterium HSG24]|nr:YbaK/EbsC family protein [Anaerolineales bacterium HSG24]
MPPSPFSQLLIEQMEILPHETILDLGAGTGVVSLAARQLGAGALSMVDVERNTLEIISTNLSLNQVDSTNVTVKQSDLFKSLNGDKFDHILINPPSIPTPPDQSLSSAYDSGPFGRAIHDPVQHTAKYYLNPGGRLTMVHGSLCNLELSLQNLTQNGFSYDLAGPFEFPFRDFYAVDYFQKLAEQGQAKIIKRNGKLYEERYVIKAKLDQPTLPRALVFLREQGVSYRLLPHKKIAKTVELAVEERGVPVEEMVKCILLKDKKGRFVLACLTGEATLNTQAVRKYEDGLTRLSFASPEEISTMLGYQLGSVAPLNLRQSIPVVLDNQIKSQTKLNISSGDPRLGLELETETLLNLLDQPIFGDISN